MGCANCKALREAGDGEPDCSTCELLALDQELTEQCRRAWRLYLKIANPLARGLGLAPVTRIQMTLEEAGQAERLVAEIHTIAQQIEAERLEALRGR